MAKQRSSSAEDVHALERALLGIAAAVEQPFAIDDEILAVADVSRCFELPERECYALKFWHPKRYVLGQFYPGAAPMFASDAAPALDAFNERHKLRRRRPVNFEDVLILPVTGWIRKFGLANREGKGQSNEGDQHARV